MPMFERGTLRLSAAPPPGNGPPQRPTAGPGEPAAAPIEVVAGLLECSGRWLVARRPASARHAGRWEFPGGKVEAGESLAAALARELHEELGLTVDPADVAEARFRDDRPGQPGGRGHLRLHFLPVRKWAGSPTTGEPGGISWLLPREILELDLLDADRQVAVALAAGGTGSSPTARHRPGD